MKTERELGPWTLQDYINEVHNLRKQRKDLLEALEAFLRAPNIGSNGMGSSTIEVQDYHLRDAREAIALATKECKI